MERAAYMDRIDRLKERVLNTRPEMDLENARLLTESFQETEGEPLPIRKAKGLLKQCQEKTIWIAPDELVVGSYASKPRAGLLNPDSCWSILDDELDTISTRKYDPFYLTPEDRKIFEEIIRPYWKGKSTFEAWAAQIPPVTRTLRDNGVLYCNKKAVRGYGEVTAGYQQVVDEGAEGIRRRVEARKSQLDLLVAGDYEKIICLDSMLIAAEALATLGRRYSQEAQRLAALEADPKRKAELLQIAETCAHVPEHGARTFREAVQAMFFYQNLIFMEQNASSYNPGRIDQYLYPYYKADLEAGRITREEAQEVLDCLWVKFAETCLFQDAKSAEFAAGYPAFQNVCVGGVDLNGDDAVNELSYMALQATTEVQLYQPSLSVRYNLAKNPDQFLRRVVELMSLGTGFPAFHNDDIGIRMMMNKGIPLQEALGWSPGGCVEPYLAGKIRCLTEVGNFNLGSAVEYALTDGYRRRTGEYVGARTGDPRTFGTYEDFETAIHRQLDYIIEAAVRGSHIIDDICEQNRPCPALSMTFPECIENAKDFSTGGAKYCNGNGILMVGIADIVNSMAAVKKLVYDDKSITMGELLDALDRDFEGCERIQKLCLEAPKYGNDDPYADSFVGKIFTYIADKIESYRGKYGKMTTGIIPVSGNTPFGLDVDALPSGRKAGKPLAEGVSPSGGTDFNGPSAVLKSVSKIPHDRFVQGTLLNMKIEPTLLSTPSGIAQVMNLLKTMCSLGIYHIQFNVVSQEKLIDAQKHPENYKGLLVRVAGYTAYFVELGKGVQDEIISRTMQSSISVG